MVEEWSVPVWAVLAASAAAVLLLAVLLVLVLRSRAEVRDLRSRLAALEDRTPAPVARSEPVVPVAPVPVAAAEPAEQYVITSVGDGPAPRPAVPAPLFADLVLRESVVQAASFAAGLRRALSPEARNRIRFEVRREVKRSRRQRRADTRAARRAWEAAQRAGAPESAPGTAQGSAA